MNKKGFVLIETLVVTIFTMFIFTILYNSIVPLLGKYKELSYYDDLDTTYDLYYLKNFVKNDENYKIIKENGYKKITCDYLEDKETCEVLYDFLDIKETDEILFLNTSEIEKIQKDETISVDIKNYLKYMDKKYIDNSNNMFLLQKDGYISYLSSMVKPILNIEEEGTIYDNKDNHYETEVTITFRCDSVDDILSLEILDKDDNILESTIGEDGTNVKSKSFVLSTKGENQLIKGRCKTIYNLEDNKEEQYTIYKYFSNNEDMCGCSKYGTKKCNCKQVTTYGSWGSSSCYTSNQSDTSSRDWSCVKDGEMQYCEGSARWYCKSRSKGTKTECDTCTDYSNCKTANSCWHS